MGFIQIGQEKMLLYKNTMCVFDHISHRYS